MDNTEDYHKEATPSKVLSPIAAVANFITRSPGRDGNKISHSEEPEGVTTPLKNVGRKLSTMIAGAGADLTGLKFPKLGISEDKHVSEEEKYRKSLSPRSLKRLESVQRQRAEEEFLKQLKQDEKAIARKADEAEAIALLNRLIAEEKEKVAILKESPPQRDGTTQ